MIAYKYVVSERIDVLEHSRIRFTQPGALNDPFETSPCWDEYKSGLLESLLNESKKWGDDCDSYAKLVAATENFFPDLPRRFGEHFAILSLSKQRNNLLMWSHYAGCHRGFVIGFDSDSPFFAPGGFSRDGLREVNYSGNRWMFPCGGLDQSQNADLSEANMQMFFTKSVHWSYEEELRLLAHPDMASTKIAVPGGYDICLYAFPTDCVHEIILGSFMPQHQASAVKELMRAKYPNAQLFRAALDDRRFDLQILPAQN